MTKLLLFFVLLFTASGAFTQSENNNDGTIKGTIITSDGKPASAVTIQVAGLKRGTVTNEKGEYSIKNIKAGTYTLKVFAVSNAEQSKEIIITANETMIADFTLKENAQQLEDVVVTNKNLNRENAVVAKMPLKNLENPQVYNTVSSELLKQQVISNYDDAFRNLPGITQTWQSTGRAGDGGSYFALRGFDAQPTLTNGLPGLTSGNVDPANVEEIQVLKGPSGTLFGGSFYSYGGLINTITKKPYYNFGGELAYNFGSFGLNRFTADINAPLSKTEKIAMRINTAYQTENSFQDAGFKKSFFIAPSFVYEVNDKLSFNIMAEILEEERAVAPVFFQSDRFSPLPFKTVEELNLDPKLSFTSNDLTIRNPRFNLQAQMIYKLSDKWTSQTVVSRGNIKSDGIYTYIWDDVAGDNDFSQYFHKENQTTSTTDIQQNFNGDFKIGKLRNRLLIGIDYYNRSIIDNGSGWAWARNVTPQGDVNYVDPYSGDTLATVDLSKASIDNLLAGTGTSNSNISNSSYSTYISDVLNITPNVLIMASVRGDYFDSKGEKSTDEDDYNQFAVSPKFGIVYQPVLDKVSLFANYMNAFINVDPIQVADEDGSNPRIQSFKPEHANQLEFGAKLNLFANKLFSTVSFYKIEVINRVTGNPNNFYNYLQGGKVRSKGFEIDINANPVNGFNLIAGYSYNSIKVLVGDEDDFYSEPGRSPGGQGPQNLVNAWATYIFTKGAIKDFGIGVGGNYGSRYKVIDNTKTGDFYLPSYAVLNTSLFYNNAKFRCAFNVNNITNKQYYTGYWSINPQKPVNFAASVAFKF